VSFKSPVFIWPRIWILVTGLKISVLNRIILTVSKALSTLIVRGTLRNIYQKRVRLIGKYICGSVGSMVIDIDNDDAITLAWTQFDSVISGINRCERDV